ncbi:MAG: hypothetical protein HIU82_12520 [Proteobacteria bacterium]|nr:hypothetical protein [Pseudomonadota bacterium]
MSANTAPIVTLDDGTTSARSAAAKLIARGHRTRPPESLKISVRADNRTRLGREMNRFREAMLAALGPTPTNAQRAMVEQAIQLRTRMIPLDAKFVETGVQSIHDSRVYLAWSNSYCRLLDRLGLDMSAAAEPQPSLAAALAAGRREVTPDGADGAERVDHPPDPGDLLEAP